MVNGRLRGVPPAHRAQPGRGGDPGESKIINVGDEAPDFQLPALIEGVKKTFRLNEYRGQKNVVLAFYPFNWQETSARQIAEYQAQRARVLAAHAETVGISVDSIMNTTAWEREIGPLDFPLCSDFWPHGEISARYGVLQDTGAASRAVFVLNKVGRVVFREVYGDHIVPPMDALLGVLEEPS
jgi:alkyl hydroperoxide reductase subunit AhpC